MYHTYIVMTLNYAAKYMFVHINFDREVYVVSGASGLLGQKETSILGAAVIYWCASVLSTASAI